MPGAFQTHHHHIDALSLPQDGIISNTIQSQMAISPIRTYSYFTILNPDDHLVHDNFHISVYMESNTFESTIQLTRDLLPVSIIIPQLIQFTHNTIALRALFDSGRAVTLVHAQVLTNGVVPTQSNIQTFTTIAGQFESKQRVLFQNIVLPEFKRTAKIDLHSCQVFHGSCAYDIIIRCDLMRKIHFKINFDNNTIECMDITVLMCPSNFFDDTILPL